MDPNQRLELVTNSVTSTNKKLKDVLEQRDEFLVALKSFRGNLDPNSSFQVKATDM